MEVICPNCKKPAYLGAIFCEECGSRLDLKQEVTTRSINSQQIPSAPFPEKGKNTPPSLVISSASQVPSVDPVIVLQMIETSQVFPLKGKVEYLLGRTTPDQMIRVDVDFSQLNGFELGVSRNHARLFWKNQQVFLEDLGSSNGTRVNGEKIPAHLPRILQNGDQIMLGKIKIRAIIRT